MVTPELVLPKYNPIVTQDSIGILRLVKDSGNTATGQYSPWDIVLAAGYQPVIASHQ